MVGAADAVEVTEVGAGGGGSDDSAQAVVLAKPMMINAQVVSASDRLFTGIPPPHGVRNRKSWAFVSAPLPP